MRSRLIRRWSTLLCALGAIVVLVACAVDTTSTPTPPQVALKIGFSDSVAPLMTTVLPIFIDENPALNVESSLESSVRLLDDLLLGQLDATIIAGSPDLILGRATTSPPDTLWTTPVAWDGLAFITNPDNPVSGLTLAQARSVFQGQIWSWDTVGGPAVPIEVVIREDGSGTRELFQEMVMEESRITLTAVVAADAQAVVDYVAIHPWAIGVEAAGSVDERVKVLALEGHYPTPENLGAQSYELTFPIYFVASSEPAAQLRELPIWLLSRDGQAVLGRIYGRVR